MCFDKCECRSGGCCRASGRVLTALGAPPISKANGICLKIKFNISFFNCQIHLFYMCCKSAHGYSHVSSNVLIDSKIDKSINVVLISIYKTFRDRNEVRWLTSHYFLATIYFISVNFFLKKKKHFMTHKSSTF